jgi:FkbM family methyltransferase
VRVSPFPLLFCIFICPHMTITTVDSRSLIKISNKMVLHQVPISTNRKQIMPTFMPISPRGAKTPTNQSKTCWLISLGVVFLLLLPFAVRITLNFQALKFCAICDKSTYVARSITINKNHFYIHTLSPFEDSTGSKSVMRNGYINTPVFSTFLKIFAKSPTPSLVVDVGCGFGFFSLLSAFHGHHVISYEIQSHYINLLQSSVLLNDYAHLVAIKRKAISNSFNETLIFPKVSFAKDSGGHGVVTISEHGEESVYTTSLDLEFPSLPKILILRMDVEIHENDVLDGAWNLLESDRIENLIIEINTLHFASLRRLWNLGWKYVNVLRKPSFIQSYFSFEGLSLEFVKLKEFLHFVKLNEKDEKLEIWLRKTRWTD